MVSTSVVSTSELYGSVQFNDSVSYNLVLTITSVHILLRAVVMHQSFTLVIKLSIVNIRNKILPLLKLDDWISGITCGKFTNELRHPDP